MISAELREFENDRHTFHVRRPGDNTWHRIGQLSRPGVTDGFRLKYYATLDEDGRILLHAGEGPYRMAASAREVIEQPGSVYRSSLEPAENTSLRERDPFSGSH